MTRLSKLISWKIVSKKMYKIKQRHIKYRMRKVEDLLILKKRKKENQDGGVGRHTAPPRTTRTDRESNSKGDQHQGNRK